MSSVPSLSFVSNATYTLKPFIMLINNSEGFNRVMLVMHRPFFAYKSFSSSFYTSSMARIVCLGAAKETISTFFKPRLRLLETSFYYHRVIAATLMILTIAFESPQEERIGLLEIYSKSSKVLEEMQGDFSNYGTAILQVALKVLSPGGS
jgi:hypothetical protein